MIIGIVSGFVVVYTVIIVENTFKIDDPVVAQSPCTVPMDSGACWPTDSSPTARMAASSTALLAE